jgi:hypothetical protein
MTSVSCYMQIMNMSVDVRREYGIQNKTKLKKKKKVSNLYTQPRHFVLTKIMQQKILHTFLYYPSIYNMSMSPELSLPFRFHD